MSKDQKKILVFVGLLILVALLIGGAFWWYQKHPVQKVYYGSFPNLSTESLAKLPKMFPVWLVLGQDPVVVSAKTIKATPTALLEYQVNLQVQNELDAVVQEYEDILPNFGYSFQVKPNVQGATITAQRNPNKVVITLTPNSTGTGIVILFLPQFFTK